MLLLTPATPATPAQSKAVFCDTDPPHRAYVRLPPPLAAHPWIATGVGPTRPRETAAPFLSTPSASKEKSPFVTRFGPPELKRSLREIWVPPREKVKYFPYIVTYLRSLPRGFGGSRRRCRRVRPESTSRCRHTLRPWRCRRPPARPGVKRSWMMRSLSPSHLPVQAKWRAATPTRGALHGSLILARTRGS